MAPLLNELLEEAAGLAAQLAEKATSASHAVDALTAQVRALADKVASEADETHQKIHDVTAKLAAAEGSVETAGRTAQTNLETLDIRADELEIRAGEVLAQVKRSVGEVEAGEDTVTGTLATRLEAAENDFEQTSREVQDLATATDERMHAASAAISQVHHSLEDMREQWSQAQGRLLGAMDQLERAAWDQAQAYADQVGATVRQVARSLVAMGNHILDVHNSAVVALRQKWAEDMVQKIEAALEPVRVGMVTLGTETGSHAESLQTAALEIGEKLDGVVEVLRERLGPVLAHSERLQ